MEGFPKKLKNLGIGAAAVISSITAKAENFGNKNQDINTDINKETGITENKKDLDSKTVKFPGGGGGLENKDYRIDTMQVTEKGDQQYIILKLTKREGGYSSYQEVIRAVMDINPDIIFLTPAEVETFLSENRNNISKSSYYVALGADVRGLPVDIKASGASGAQFNTYKFEAKGTILVAGSSSPSDNDYLFPARMKIKKLEESKDSK